MSEIVSRYEVGEMSSQLFVPVVMEAFDDGLLVRAVDAFDLAIDPGVTGLCQPVPDLTGNVEAYRPGADAIPVLRPLCERNAVIGENAVNPDQGMAPTMW
ncbi:hypothetical protein [Gemmobacter sp. 24YEA27]|uniref:hypothetical protein n=1 Tax=Gemmobacter sp. 24YEA27 TaxID=3040672 RepID=UPI0024B3711B|nr:hypothetical protein [Gemmobacter sp. 24YEA27]